MKEMEYDDLGEFKKDLKKLSKRYKSLKDDIEIIKKVLNVTPTARPPFSFNIDGLGVKDCVIKVKKIACKSIKGKGVNTGLRLVYAYFEKRVEAIDGVETEFGEKIVFIELYHKNDKANENKERILKYFK
jgi:mRNA-degrading endonuclease YafQ of YafQ-DinJ toxin-antitoxin module